MGKKNRFGTLRKTDWQVKNSRLPKRVAENGEKNTVAKGVFQVFPAFFLCLSQQKVEIDKRCECWASHSNLWNFPKDLLCWLKWCLGCQAEIKTS